MLGVIANKQKKDEKGVKYIYIGKWVSADNRRTHNFVRFAIESDDNSRKVDFENLSGIEGDFRIRTKSVAPFKPEDLFYFKGQKYSIINVDGNRKIDGELSQVWFNNNGNITTFLTLRKDG